MRQKAYLPVTSEWRILQMPTHDMGQTCRLWAPAQVAYKRARGARIGAGGLRGVLILNPLPVTWRWMACMIYIAINSQNALPKTMDSVCATE